MCFVENGCRSKNWQHERAAAQARVWFAPLTVRLTIDLFIMIAKRLSFGVACFLALSVQAQTYNFTSTTSATNGWQPYSPLASFGVTSTFSEGFYGYLMESSASPNPAALGAARVGSFLPGTYTDFSLNFSVLSYNGAGSEFVGAAARFSNLGLGTSSGYVMGYESGVGTGGALFIAKVVDEASKGAIGAGAEAAVTLAAGQGYEFTFSGTGTALSGAVYSLANLNTPLATVSGTDSSFASGQLGLLVADESSAGTGTPGASFGQFTVVPEPGCGALLVLGGLTLWAARTGRKH